MEVTREITESKIRELAELSYQIYLEQLEIAALEKGILIPNEFYTTSFKMTYFNGFLDGVSKGMEIQKKIMEVLGNQNGRSLVQ